MYIYIGGERELAIEKNKRDSLVIAFSTFAGGKGGGVATTSYFVVDRCQTDLLIDAIGNPHEGTISQRNIIGIYYLIEYPSYLTISFIC